MGIGNLGIGNWELNYGWGRAFEREHLTTEATEQTEEKKRAWI
jgi:hypothetical protein